MNNLMGANISLHSCFSGYYQVSGIKPTDSRLFRVHVFPEKLASGHSSGRNINFHRIALSSNTYFKYNNI